jgi:hypothetical protein
VRRSTPVRRFLRSGRDHLGRRAPRRPAEHPGRGRGRGRRVLGRARYERPGAIAPADRDADDFESGVVVAARGGTTKITCAANVATPSAHRFVATSRLQHRHYLCDDVIYDIVLPESENRPSGDAQVPVGLAVTLHVAREFLRPPSSVARRRGLVVRTAVPEATLDEDRDMSPRERDVGPSPRHAGQRPVNAVPIAQRVKTATEDEFWMRVTSCLA